MKYKAAIFDIDGTILPKGKVKVPLRTRRALKRLKRAGVKVIIATGRGPARADREILGDIEYDYIICANGACILRGDRSVYYVDTYEQENIDEIVEISERMGLEVKFIYLDGYYMFKGGEKKKLIYRENMPLEEVFEQDLKANRRGIAETDELPFAAFVITEQNRCEEFNGLSEMHFMVPFCDHGFDILKSETDKVHSISDALDEMGIDWSETVTFGDGLNDLEMIKRAGLGVAMENSVPELKAAARLVAPRCDEYGVCKAIKDIFKE